MSLHRYFPPPPLALAIHPAPTSRPKGTNKDKHDKAKVNLQAKADKEKQDQKEQGGKADKCTPTKCDAIVKIKDGAVLTPISPGSNLPEPPTSALGAVVSDNDKEADAKKSQPEQKDNDQIDSTSKLTDQVPEALAEKKDDGSEHIHKETDLEPEPLILLSPAPYRPLRTRLDLHPSVVYPPVNTDPRGAYHKYAKAVGAEVIYVDVTKDGWLTQQWKERNEREALKRLTGEWEKELQKEIEKERKRVIKKTVPKTSEGILLNLWNELVEANNHEVRDALVSQNRITEEICSFRLMNSGTCMTGTILKQGSTFVLMSKGPSYFPNKITRLIPLQGRQLKNQKSNGPKKV